MIGKNMVLWGSLAWATFACSSDSGKTENPAVPEVSIAATADPYFIHLSDVHLNASATCSAPGMDTGSDLWNITKAKLDSIISGQYGPKPMFILYTGDLPVHTDLSDSSSCNHVCHSGPGCSPVACRSASITQMLTDLYDLVNGTEIPLLYLPGNNDGLACDYASFAELQSGNLITPLDQVPSSDSFPAVNAAMPCGSPPCIVSNADSNFGYYSARPVAGLRVIALNSIILGKKYHSEDGVSQKTAGDAEMQWLSSQLADAAALNEKVYLAMHIPPGMDYYGGDDYWHDAGTPGNWLDQFLGLTTRYQNTIAGVLYGHSHMDELRLITDSANTSVITEAAISAPGITPLHDNNPGFKLVYYNSTSKEIMNFVTYYTKFPLQSYYGNNSYQFSVAFGCPAGTTLCDCLKNKNDTTAIIDSLNFIYMVKADTTPVNYPSALFVKNGM